jgi:hypothetical protein
MNADGTGTKPLVECSKEESPFYKSYLESFILSNDAEKIAFVTQHREENLRENRTWIHTLWWMNLDGTGLKSHTLDVPYGREARLVAWPRFEDRVALEIKPRAILRENSQIIMIDLEDGTSQVLAEKVLSPWLWHPSPYQDYLTFTIRDPDAEKDRFILMDLITFESTELFSEEVLGLIEGKWGPDESKIAFFWPRELRFQDRELWVYDLDEEKFLKMFQRSYQHDIRYDWTPDGQKLIFLVSIDGENQLIIVDKNFGGERTFKTPMQFKGAVRIWGLENCALLKESGKGAFWRVDLETEDWKKVY